MNKVSDIAVSHQSIISLHAQLHHQLRHLILSGKWSTGSRIPSESAFAQHLKISRSTVRLALQQAEVEGLIERFAGRGTFVAYRMPDVKENRLIAFVAQRFDSDALLMMLKGAESEARVRGYQIILTTVQNQQEEIAVLQRLKAENIVGILILPDANASRPTSENENIYSSVTLPTVTMDRVIYGLDCDCVTSDHYGGAFALMEHLVELGHQRIVFLTHPQTHMLAVEERYRAYEDVLLKHGLNSVERWLIGQSDCEISASYAFQVSVGSDYPELYQIKAHFESSNPSPTAIFALNDYVAIIAMRALKLMNVPLPASLSVVGFDDIDLAAHLEVPLTTAAQDPYTIGRQAARRLFDRLEGDNRPFGREIIPTQLRMRQSATVPSSIKSPLKGVMSIE
jgi:GntR family transcriptional regulator, arabinose operon transcriptional repressor